MLADRGEKKRPKHISNNRGDKAWPMWAPRLPRLLPRCPLSLNPLPRPLPLILRRALPDQHQQLLMQHPLQHPRGCPRGSAERVQRRRWPRRAPVSGGLKRWTTRPLLNSPILSQHASRHSMAPLGSSVGMRVIKVEAVVAVVTHLPRMHQRRHISSNNNSSSTRLCHR